MYEMQLRRAASFEEMPWKNGQGSTIELAKFPASADLSRLDFVWRVSVATIRASGPFSGFPGYDRHIALVDGDAPTLVHEAGDRQTQAVLEPCAPHTFSGDWTTHCELAAGATCRDFNVMARRGVVNAKLEPLQVSGERKRLPLAAAWHLLYVVSGAVVGEIGDFDVEIGAGDTLLLVQQAAGATETLHLRAQLTNSAQLLAVSLRLA